MEFEIGGEIHAVDPAEIDRLPSPITGAPGDTPGVKLGEALLSTALIAITPPQDNPTEVNFPRHPPVGSASARSAPRDTAPVQNSG